MRLLTFPIARSAGILAIAVCLLFGNAARAESNDTVDTLTLNQALAAANTRAGNVAAATRSLREAQARRVGAGVWMPSNPRVMVEARPPITGGNAHDIGYGATLDIPISIGGAPGARGREADRGIEVAKSELEVERAGARASVWATYVRASVANQRTSALQDAREIVARIALANKQRLDAGAVGETDQSIAMTEAAEVEVAWLRSKSNEAAELMQLRESIDYDAERALSLVSRIEAPPAVAPLQALFARASTQRPELRVFAQRLRQLDATSERLDKELFPAVSIYGGVDAAPVSPVFGFVGLSVELPVAQRNQGPRALAAAAKGNQLQLQTLDSRRVLREIAALREAYAARCAELKTLDESALPGATRTLELIEIGWRAGRLDLFRVTTALRELNRLRGVRLDAFQSAWLAYIDLDRAVGGAGP